MSNGNVRSSVGTPNCIKMIPIYPVRYAVMPSEGFEYLYSKNANFKTDFPNTLKQTSYCLRTLRLHGYVYLYDPAAREKWSCFYYGNASGLGFYQRKINPSDGSLKAVDNRALSYTFINAHFHKPSKIYIGYTDSPYTSKIMADVEAGSLKTEIMQEIDVGTWIDAADQKWQAGKQALTTAPQVKHAFLPTDIQTQVLDYSEHYNIAWSEEDDNSLPPSAILSGLKRASPTALQLSVALYDAIGIASELSHLVGYEVAKLNQFADENARKAWASSTIDALTEQAGWRAFHQVTGNAAEKGLTDLSKKQYIENSGQLLRDRESIYQQQIAAQAEKKHEFESYNRQIERQTFKQDFPKQQQQIQQAIDAAGNDHASWLDYDQQGGLKHALKAYEPEHKQSYLCLRAAVARCIDALPATEAGVNFGARQLNSDGPNPDGIFFAPMLGYPAMLDYVDENKSIGFATEQLSTEKLSALTLLLNKIPADNASKTLATVVTALLLEIRTVTSLSIFERTRYPTSLEALDGVLAKTKSLPLNEFIEQMQQEKSTGRTQTVFHHTTSTVVLKTAIPVLYTEEVPIELTPEQSARKSDILQRTKFWSDIKIGVSGFGLFLGGWSTIEALERLNKDDKNILINSIGLSSSVLATGSGSALLTQVLFEKRAYLAIGDKKLQLKELAGVFDKAALGLLAAAAIMAGVKDAVSAVKTSSTRRQVTYALATSTQGVVTGLATYSLLTKIAEGGNLTAQKALTHINANFYVKGVGAFGSRLNIGLTLGVFIIEAIAFALETYAEAHGDDEVLEWVAQSVWGNNPNISWDILEEQYALNKLFVSPKIITDFNWLKSISRQSVLLNPLPVLTGKPGLSTDIAITLPGYKSQVSEYTISKDGIDIKDKGKLDKKAGATFIIIKDVSWFGDIKVDYWPDHNLDIKYTAED